MMRRRTIALSLIATVASFALGCSSQVQTTSDGSGIETSPPTDTSADEAGPDSGLEDTGVDTGIDTAEGDAATDTQGGDADLDAGDALLDVTLADAPADGGVLDTASDAEVGGDLEDANEPDLAMEDVPLVDLTDTPLADTPPVDPVYELEFYFENVEQEQGELPVMQTMFVQIPDDFVSVEAQIQVRGDLDNFPMAYMTLLIEDGGKLIQCGDVSGLPQEPNNILDDVFRIAWPRPENLDQGSVFYPPLPPYDFQPLPCQAAFEGKEMIEIGMLGVGIYPPGTAGNQGPNACGGAGCPNDAIVKIRFIPPDGEICVPGQVAPCVCPGGGEGLKTCQVNMVFDLCECPELEDVGGGDDVVDEDVGPDVVEMDAPAQDALEPPEQSGTCADPVPLEVSASNPVVQVTLPGTVAHQVWPNDPFDIACFTSKPPFSVETFYKMIVKDAGTVTIDVVDYDPPWDFNQYWIDIQSKCGFGGALQCGQSYMALQGDAEVGEFLLSLTHAPPDEIYIPDQDGWTFTLQVTLEPN